MTASLPWAECQKAAEKLLAILVDPEIDVRHAVRRCLPPRWRMMPGWRPQDFFPLSPAIISQAYRKNAKPILLTERLP